MTNPHIGSAFDDFLIEQGIYDEVIACALERLANLTESDEAVAQCDEG